MTRALFALAVVLALALMPACGSDNGTCRPNTLHIAITFDSASMGADHLRIIVDESGTMHSADVAYTSGNAVQVFFPNNEYPAGATINVTVEALKNGVVLSSGTKSGVVLGKTCGAIALTFAGAIGGGDMHADMNIHALDLIGADLSGADLTSASTDDLTGVAQPDLATLPNSAACTMDVQCTNGHCVDGVCCDLACGGQCQACDVVGFVGQCVGVAAGPPHGSRNACGGTDKCAGACSSATADACTYPGASTACQDASCVTATGTFTPAGACDGAGACNVPASSSCGTNGCNASMTACTGACATNTDCNGSPAGAFCNLPAGVCKTTKTNGAACTTTTECTSGNCTDGVCCDLACGGQCQACNLGGANVVGTCATVTSGAPVSNAGTTRAACGGDVKCPGSCNGTSATACGFGGGSCGSTCANGTRTPLICSGGSCVNDTTSAACTSMQCQDGTSCLGTCNGMDSLCGTNRWCDGVGVCHPIAGLGGNCNADHECGTAGHCVGHICCASGCGGATPSCSADGSMCVCNSTSCSALGSKYTCGGSGQCVCSGCGGTLNACSADGNSCVCSGSSCSTMGNKYTCNGTSCVCSLCTGNTPACSTDGMTCLCTGSPAQGSCASGQLCKSSGACCDNSCPSTTTGCVSPSTNNCGNPCPGNVPAGNYCCSSGTSYCPNGQTCDPDCGCYDQDTVTCCGSSGNTCTTGQYCCGGGGAGCRNTPTGTCMIH